MCGHIEYADELPDDFTCPICGWARRFRAYRAVTSSADGNRGACPPSAASSFVRRLVVSMYA
ncbi:MAG: hypothetical protein ACLT98_13595 [Eggerthellaceae bacterium]